MRHADNRAGKIVHERQRRVYDAECQQCGIDQPMPLQEHKPGEGVLLQTLLLADFPYD
jgi:hypothetical protein